LEREVAAALENVSLDSLVSGSPAPTASQELEIDSRHRAVAIRLHGDHVFFSLGGRNEGVISVRQFPQPPAIGDEVEVVVRAYHAEDGLYELHLVGSAVQVGDWSDLTEGAIVDARITGANTGGLECMVGTLRGFIPSSQIGLFRVEDFAQYLGQKLPCVATEVNPKRRNLVLSHRAFLEREREESRKQLLASLEPGQTVEGVVRNLRDFGAFVDLGGVDGLIHVSQLSWERVNHPRDVLQEGQKVRVRIEKVNPQTGKVSLAYRDLLDHPWATVEAKFPPGTMVKGPVSRIAKFGAFVKLAPGVEGLIHISELAHRRVRQVSDVVSEGQEVDAKVLSVDAAAQRMALSLKAAQPEPEPAQEAQELARDEPKREVAFARRKSPLKGGVDRPSGGEQFGLRW
jgi:small subunit ribosomal protein S1